MAFRSRRRPGARRYVRFTRCRRERFFHVLEESGHAPEAAEAAGVSVDCIYRLRRVEKGFAERMDLARDRADARLRAEECEAAQRRREFEEDERWAEPGPSAAPSPRPSPASGRGSGTVPGEGDWREGLFVVQRGRGGRLRRIAAGTRFWTSRHDAVFLGHLRSTGNVAASARAAGFTPKTAYNRRERLPAFARAWERELAEAERRLEQRVVAEAIDWTPAMSPGAFETGEPDRLDPWLALNYLKWRERKRRRR